VVEAAAVARVGEREAVAVKKLKCINEHGVHMHTERERKRERERERERELDNCFWVDEFGGNHQACVCVCVNDSFGTSTHLLSLAFSVAKRGGEKDEDEETRALEATLAKTKLRRD
jgi:hypothetical protein